MKRTTGNGILRTIFLAVIILLIGSNIVTVQAQGKVKVGGNIYGGGEAAKVTGNGSVFIHGSVRDTILGSVFGGGEGSRATVEGNTYVSVSNGKLLTNVYGGGALCQVEGSTTVNVNGGEIGAIRYIKDGTTYFNKVEHLTGGNVFGGGMGSEDERDEGLVKGNTNVNLSDGIVYYNVYGGGEMASVGERVEGYDNEPGEGGKATVRITGGQVGPAPKMGEGYDIPIAVNGFDGFVFGGGMGNSDDYGGDDFKAFSDVNYTEVTIDIPSDADPLTNRIWGAVFGGAEDGHVLGDTKVDMRNGIVGTTGADTYDGNIFGGGRNIIGYENDNFTAGRVRGNCLVNMIGGHVLGNIYGGGSMGNIGCNLDGEQIDYDESEPYGKVTVSIIGGEVGTAVKDDNIGNVFGGSKGKMTDYDWYNYGIANQVEVIIRDSINGNTTVSSPIIHGSLYGGGEIGWVMNSSLVNIAGGTIGGVSTTGNHYGSVYGGGKGFYGNSDYDPNFEAGEVFVSTEVNVSGGHVYENVYGGGELSWVGYLEGVNPILGDTKVTFTGGQVGRLDGTGLNGHVYGGGRGIGNDSDEDYKVFANVRNTEVTIEIPEDADIATNRVWGSVFGGAADGHLLGDAVVKMKSGTIGTDGTAWNGNIYGGGHNSLGKNYTAGRVEGNTHITMEGGTLKGSIYGGGRLGLIGIDEDGDMYASDPDDHGNTLVEITGGTVEKDVYGGGKGNTDTIKDNSGNILTLGENLARVKNTEVNISGTAKIIGNVYGGGEKATVGWYDNNNVAEEHTGLAKIHISGGQVGNEQIGTAQESIVGGNVYGGGLGIAGGKKALPFANVDTTYVKVSDDAYIIGSVFGGGDNGHVWRNTSIAMTGGTVGQKNILKEFITDECEQPFGHIYTGSILAGGRGTAKDTNGQYNDTTGRVFGNTSVTVKGGVVRHAVYGGGGLSSVGTYTINGFLPVFEAGTGKTCVTIDSCAIIGPKMEDLTVVSGEELAATASLYNGVPLATAQQYADTAFKYLGGNSGWVFGSGCGLADSDCNHLTANDSAIVTINGYAQVVGNVYGGGENAHLMRSTVVNVKGGIIGGLPLHGTDEFTVDTGVYKNAKVHLAANESEIKEDKYSAGRHVFRGNVYGGGKGTDTIVDPSNDYVYNLYAGRVYGNTNVTISDSALIYNRVFGGGSLASVGTYSYTGLTDLYDQLQGVRRENGTGVSTVTIKGGQIGTDGNNNGDVFGGGRGLVGSPDSPLLKMAYVGETHVTIDSANIKSNVYGGSASGHVYGDAHVTVNGGTIGIAGHGGWHSNVYGGGGGQHQYKRAGKPDHLSITSGRVYGDSYVTIDQKDDKTPTTIYHNVYGGGAIASVGTYNIGAASPVVGGGHAHVTVKGGTLGVDGNENGMVFGSGRGEIDSIRAFADSLSFAALTTVNIGTVDNTNPSNPVYSGNAKIKGSVYGSGENGHVFSQTTINVYGGTIGCENYDPEHPDPHFAYRGNVYGGGCGTDMFDTDNDGKDDTYNPMSGIVYGNTKVNIYGGYISRNVYGGGAMASVGLHTATERHKTNNTLLGDTLSWPAQLVFSMGGKTEVNIHGGHIGTVALASDPLASGCVYGAARGEAGDRYKMAGLANVKETYVTVDFATPDNNTYNNNTADVIIGSVFGGGESGHVYDTTSVTVDNGFIVGSVFGAGDGTDTYKDLLMDPENPNHYLTDSTLVYSITAGKVYGNTSVTVNGGRILHNVYGGGNLASVGKSNYLGYGEDGTDNNTLTTGRTHVRIYGGIIGTDGNENGHVFGSSRGLTFQSVNLSPRYNYSRDFFMGYTNQPFVTIGKTVEATPNGNSPRINGSVFGGGQNGHVRMHTNVVIKDAEIGVQYDPNSGQPVTADLWKNRGNVYGAGRGIDKIPGTEDYCSSAGSVTLNTTVTIEGGLIHRNVYGGGSLATVGPPPTNYNPGTSLCTVDIKGGTIGDESSFYVDPDADEDNDDSYHYGGNVFGAGRGLSLASVASFCNAAATDVTIEGGRVIGEVYGGGEDGHVTGNTNVLVTTGANIGIKAISTFDGNVFGGGMGSGEATVIDDHDNDDPDDDDIEFRIIPHCGRVGGNTNVTMDGGEIKGTIYGGGRLALVGVKVNGEPYLTNTGAYDSISDHGLATITVSGTYDDVHDQYSTIIGNSNGNELLNGSDESIGDIFGSGKGDMKNYEDVLAGRVGNSKINITGSPRIYGSVFGGGEMASLGYWNIDNVNHKAPFYDYSGTAEIKIGESASDNPVIGTELEYDADYLNDPSEWTIYETVGGVRKLIHTCTGNVFGGCQGDIDITSPHWVSMGRSRIARIEINGGQIMSDVFGGSEQGSVADSSYVVINGGTIGSEVTPSSGPNYNFGSVYGGGYGCDDEGDIASTYTWHNQTYITENDSTEFLSNDLWRADYLAGRTYGNTRVHLNGGLVRGSVYGGASMAYIGGYAPNLKGNAKLYIGNDSQVGDNEKGVTIQGNVYGANNIKGSPLGNVEVHVIHTQHEGDNIYPTLTPPNEWTAELLEANALTQGYALNAVFGGGHNASYLPQSSTRASSGKSATVHVYNCENTIRYLFGGADAASIGSNELNTDTYVIVDGGRLHQVYGGGNGDDAHQANTFGTANTNINGGLIDVVFGGGKKNGSALFTNLQVSANPLTGCEMLVDSIFGGSNEAPLEGDITTTIACGQGEYENIYGGANNADITGNVTLNILGNTIGNVFGGSKGSENKEANIYGNVTLNLHGGTITNAFGGSDMNGNITGVITVNVLDTVQACPLSVDTVYGGSNNTFILATDNTLSSPVVNIKHGTVNANVFGGSKGIAARTASNPVVNIGDNVAGHVALVKGNVYGGGTLAEVIGNTTVNINNGTVGVITYAKTTGSAEYDTIIHGDASINILGENSGNVFGGGKGRNTHLATDQNIAEVSGDTRVNIKGGKVLYSVYGGGELSSVSDSAIVTVTGGQVGPAPRVELGYNIPIGLSGIDGYVFGGGKGIGNDSIVTNPSSPYFAPYGKYYKYANVNNTLVTVNIPMPRDEHPEDSINNRIWGSVFGGAEDGHVLGNANVRYVSGYMGTKGTTSYDGNIFGGGRNYSKMNYTAGRVGGDIKVEMNGGQLFGNIYGGGRLALTGIDEKGKQVSGNGHGNTKVIVKGGKVGNERLMETFTKYSMGDVYGGGKGSMEGLYRHPAASALLLSLTRNTEIIIKDSIKEGNIVSSPIIYGTVYGGGEVANVGYFDWDTIINPKTGKLDIANIDFIPGNGHTKVVVSGGRIGADRMHMRYTLADGSYNLKYNDDIGHVFGGGEGIVDNPANYDTINPAVTINPASSAPHIVSIDDYTSGGIHNYKSLIDLMALSVSSEVIVSDNAWVKGSVYGGGGNGHVIDSTLVKIQGGQIGSGDMEVERKYTEEEFLTADSLTECPHWEYGDANGNYYPYDPLYVKADKLPSDGKSWFGNVFGGGSGFYPYIVRNASDTADSTVWNPESGMVYGNTKVEITGGHILTNVYGGGETTDVLGDSAIVIMQGGTLGVPRTFGQIGRHPVTCYLFGAGKGDPRTIFNTWTNVENVRVEVNGGWIYGSVFGGGEEGHVHRNVKLNVKGSTGTNAQAIAGEATKIGTLGYSYVDGNIFGAGRGFSGEALTAGTVGGNVNVNISGGEVLGSVYGGGRLASVGTEFASPTLPNGDPNPHYGHMQTGNDHGVVTVDISGGIIGNDHEAIRYTNFSERSTGGNVFAGGMGRITLLSGDVNTIWPNLAKVKKTNLTVRGNAVIKGSVYGGGEFGTVDENATITIEDGTIWRDVYGGGFGSNDITSIGELEVISEVSGNLVEEIVEVTPMEWAGRVKGNSKININGGWIKKSVYGGGELASVGTIDSIAKHPEHQEGAVTDTTFNISWPYFFSYATDTGADTINISGGRIGITGKDYMGPWDADGDPYSLVDNQKLTKKEIKEARKDNGDIYGGGKGIAGDRFDMAQCANVNNTVINIEYNASNAATPSNYKDTTAVNRKDCITGSVYGGGENGHVNNDARVTLTNGLVGHAVYGGGKGKDTYETMIWKIGTPHTDPADSLATIYSITAGKVYGNTYVNIDGGYVVRSVFGGGNLASVGKGNYAGGVGDYSKTGYGECIKKADDWAYMRNSGHTYVTITKGTIGYLDGEKPGDVFKDNVPYGSVFGGCRGTAVPDVPRTLTPRIKYCPEDFLGYSNHTHVTIGTKGGNNNNIHLYGSVYGGAQDGHIRWDANTVVNSGEIGVNYGGSETNLVGSDNLDTIYWTSRGNVYGAGSGIGMYETYEPNPSTSSIDTIQHYCSIAGSVTHFANVDINGGIIHRNVYGGGNLASVGPPRIFQNYDCPIDSTCVTVNIHKNGIIGQNNSEGFGGYVYGGSRGLPNNDTITDYDFKKFAYCSYTRVNIDSAQIFKNVYGGGENGQVGVDHKDAQLIHTTEVNINGNSFVQGNVFGGGQGIWGEEYYVNDTISGRVMGTSTVNLNGGTIGHNAYGGGQLGVNYGEAYVNVSGATVNENVFGGAYGQRDQIHVHGLRMVNMRSGSVLGSVYGGSFNADDALEAHPETFASNNTTETVSVVNYSGGYTDKHVFGSGDHGLCYGSTYVFIGLNAIMNAPHHTAGTAPYDFNFYNNHENLVIQRDVYAGADFGTYETGEFSDVSTITGRSEIYLDGTGYDTENSSPLPESKNFMKLTSSSLFGCGTLNDGGKNGKQIMVRNFGHANSHTPTVSDPEPFTGATRTLQSIQYADSLILESSHIQFEGRGIVSVSGTTEKYSIYDIFNDLRVVNGSSLFIDKPVDNIGNPDPDQIGALHSNFSENLCNSQYPDDPRYQVVQYGDLAPNIPTTPTNKENKIRINKGGYLTVSHTFTNEHGTFTEYGALEGFFHLMTDGVYNAFAYARPKQSQDDGNIINPDYVAEHDHQEDGGFVGYRDTLNTYNVDGGSAAFHHDGPYVQMPYENHTPKQRGGDPYFRVWRFRDQSGQSMLDLVLRAIAKPDAQDGFSYYVGTVKLPPKSGTGAFYRIKSNDGVADVNYGTEVYTVNAGMQETGNNPGWMYFNKDFEFNVDEKPIKEQKEFMTSRPNNVFGLTAIPTGGLAGGANIPVLFCTQANKGLVKNEWVTNEGSAAPQLQFLLTHSNNVNGNYSWDPVTITLEQVVDETVTDVVTLNIQIVTSTLIEQDNYVRTYAMMTHATGTGNNNDIYKAKVLLPPYTLSGTAESSNWTLKKVVWHPNTDGPYGNGLTGEGHHAFDENTLVVGEPHPSHTPTSDYVGMTFYPSRNIDNVNGWNGTVDEFIPIDLGKCAQAVDTTIALGSTKAIDPISFDIDLHYDSDQNVGEKGNAEMGTVELTLHLDNYSNGTGGDHGTDVKFFIDVLRRGKGKGFYIDGINGDIMYSGKYPDAAQPSLAGILWFADDYEPVDSIYIVNKVTADNATSTLEWSTPFNQLKIFRYPGGHLLYTDLIKINNIKEPDPYFSAYTKVYKDNPAYKGALVNVKTNMSISSAYIDGAFLLEEMKGRPDNINGTGGTQQVVARHVISNAPMFTVEPGASLTIDGVYQPTSLRNNFNRDSNGGAIDIQSGGLVKISQRAYIENNYVKDSLFKSTLTPHYGGATYIAGSGTMVVSDDVMINTNKHVVVTKDKSVDTIPENVYLNDYNTMISLGSSEGSYGALNEESRVGITKVAWEDQDYMPVIFTDNASLGTNLLTYGSYVPDQVVYDEQEVYGVLEYPLRKTNGDPNYLRKLYFAKTWVNQVTSEPDGFKPNEIDTPEELAWAISVADGFNDQTAEPDAKFSIAKDIDMNRYLWVPIGYYKDAEHDYRYQGVFEGNGYAVTGIRSSLSIPDKGMFGRTYNANIQNLQVEVELFTHSTVDYLGGIVGTMEGDEGVLSNCESAGYLQGGTHTKGIGGLVGKTVDGFIHSSFALDTIHTVSNTPIIGGLVGDNSSVLYNSFSNFSVNNEGLADTIGGLVGYNRPGSIVENCYSVVDENIYAFAYINRKDIEPSAQINYCYSNHNHYLYEQYNSAEPNGHGTYDGVKDRKDFGYMYDDNMVTLESGVINPYYPSTTSYLNAHTIVWPGLLSTLNKWVRDKNAGYTPWFRPTTEQINGDMPVLGFPMDNSMAVVEDHAFIRYNSDFDFLLNVTNKQDAKSADMFLYGDATGVTNVPDEDVNVFINEDAVLMQDNGSDVFRNATTGITFDNSWRKAHDAFGGDLTYDWHLLSSPLSNAKMGINYTDVHQNYWYTGDPGQIDPDLGVVNSYMPNRVDTLPETTVMWDYYTYYEPEYHWINFKRNSYSHHHYDYPYAFIEYENEKDLVPAKGYMMAISEDSYLSNSGTLNKGEITIPVTAMAPDDIAGQPSYNKGSNLVGNPYQAYLDLDKVALGNTREADALKDFYIYDAEAGVYSPYTSTASKNPRIPSRYIHPHQGFFVLFQPADKTEKTMDMTITPSMAGTKKDEGSYFRGGEDDKVNYPVVNLIAQNESGDRDLAIVELGRPELGGVEKVENLQNSDFKLYTHMGENNYSLLFTPVGTQRVPLFFKTPEDGNYTLTWDTHNGTCRKMLLIDNITGSEYDMLTHDSYSFTGHATDYAARFYIVFELDNPIEVEIDDEGDFAFFDGTQWVIYGEGQLELIDVLGRILYSNSMNGAHNHVTFDHVAAGTYMLHLVKDRNNVKTQKIVIH